MKVYRFNMYNPLIKNNYIDYKTKDKKGLKQTRYKLD